MPFKYVHVTFVLRLLAVMLPVQCVGADDPWQSLKDLPHNLGLTFITGDMTCQYGQIKAVAAQSILVGTDRSDVTFEKSNMVRIRGGFGGRPVPASNPNLVLATVYNGRSSWADVVGFMPFQSGPGTRFTVRMSVSTASGKVQSGDLKQVTDSGITLADAPGKEISITKSEVSRVDYLRDKPLSEKQEFYWQELAMGRIFDFKLYPRLFHLGDKMPVRLYDNAVPEDNSPVQCQ